MNNEIKDILELKTEQLNGKTVQILKRELITATPDKMEFSVSFIEDSKIKETKEEKATDEVYKLINPSDDITNTTPDKEVLLVATLVKIQYPSLIVYLNELYKDGVSDKWTVTLELPAKEKA